MLKKKAIIETKDGDVIGTKEKPESVGGATNGWSVQARVFDICANRPVIYSHPHYPNGLILTTEWQTLTFFRGNNPAGVPTSKGVGKEMLEHWGLLDREAAVALGYTFIAQHDEAYFPGIEVRVVPYKVEYSMKRWKEGEPVLLEQHLDWHEKNHRDVVHKGMPDMRNHPSRESGQ